jgi:3'-phosphoadenosine 5'-phosphosulfate sulfotransferase (PAPS reductase)/FAD synthetase
MRKSQHMEQDHNIVSVSGGKDSTALLLLAIERETENLQAVFADTGHEHPQTYAYIEYLQEHLFPIKIVKADFSEQIEKRRQMMLRVIEGTHVNRGAYEWTAEIAQQALEVLQPTGVPFLDMCLVHGRFPSTRVRFCSEELKRNPMIEQVQLPLIEAGHDVISWQGVRADESLARRNLVEMEEKRTWPNGATLWNYRPILQWTAEDCFAMHRKHGIQHNPLYEQGMGRVGCMPCIHARKDELLEISKRFPEEIKRVAEWERIIGLASKTGSATFFAASELGAETAADVDPEKHGIWAKVEWSKTSRGKKNLDLFRSDDLEPGALCTSVYGLCE